MIENHPRRNVFRFIFCLFFLFSLNFTPVQARPTSSLPIQTSAAPGDPDAPGYLDRIWTIGTWYSEIGLTGLSMADYDQDGVQEILDPGPHRWKLFSYSTAHQRYEIEYISKYYVFDSSGWYGIGCAVGANFGPGVGYRIFVTSMPNRLEVYDGASHRLITSAFFPLDSASSQNICSKMVIRDIDLDGTPEIVARSAGNLVVLNAFTFEQEMISDLNQYSNRYGEIAMAVGNADDDSALEIVLNDWMIDGVTHQVEWKPVSAIGQSLALADIDKDTREEVIAVKDYYNLVAYDADTQLVKWRIQSSSYGEFGPIFPDDSDADGIIEIIVGTEGPEFIRAFDSVNQTLKWQIDNPGLDTSSLLVGDSDADGVTEVIWGTGRSTQSRYGLYIADPVQKTIEWKTPDSGFYSTVDAGDIDADGTMEIAASACYLENGVNGMPVVVLNAATREPEWAGPFLAPDNQIYGCSTDTPLLLANIDQDSALEIIISIGDPSSSSGRLVAYDGKTHQLEWEWNSPAYSYTRFNLMKAEDVDLDGQVEVVAGETSSINGIPDPYLMIFNPITNVVEWKSPQLIRYSYSSGSTGITICNLDDDPNPELITNSSLLWVFDGKTHAQEWKKSDYTPGAVACGDVDNDGRNEVLVSTYEGSLDIFDGQTGSLKNSTPLFATDLPVNAMQLVDFNEDGRLELLTLNKKNISIYSLVDSRLLWQSQDVGWRQTSSSNPLKVKDLDGDSLQEVLVGSNINANLFRYNPEAAQNLPLTASFTADRYLIAPGAPLSYQAALTNQTAAPREFQVTIPLAGGSLAGVPAPSTGALVIEGGTLTWKLSLGTYASGTLSFTLVTPATAANDANFALTAYFEDPASSAALARSASAHLDFSRPRSSVDHPAALSVVTGSQMVLTGSSSDDHLVDRVEVSIDQGGWFEAKGTAPWTFSWTLPGDGRHNIRSRAIDAAGNVEQPGTGIDLYVSNHGPVIQSVIPADGSSGVWEGEALRVRFNIPVRPDTLTAACEPAVTLKPAQAGSDAAGLVLYHSLFPLGQQVTCNIRAAWSTKEQPMAAPVTWSFQVSPTTNRTYLPVIYR